MYQHIRKLIEPFLCNFKKLAKKNVYQQTDIPTMLAARRFMYVDTQKYNAGWRVIFAPGEPGNGS